MEQFCVALGIVHVINVDYTLLIYSILHSSARWRIRGNASTTAYLENCGSKWLLDPR